MTPESNPPRRPLIFDGEWTWNAEYGTEETSNMPDAFLSQELIDRALECPCEEGDGAICPECDCLMLLVEAIDRWVAEQRLGLPWDVIAQRLRDQYSEEDW